MMLLLTKKESGQQTIVLNKNRLAIKEKGFQCGMEVWAKEVTLVTLNHEARAAVTLANLINGEFYKSQKGYLLINNQYGYAILELSRQELSKFGKLPH